MLQILEAAIAILILLSSFIFIHFQKINQINLDIEKIRQIVYTNSSSLCSNFTYVKIIDFSNNRTYLLCNKGYSILFSYLFSGNKTNYEPLLVILGR